MTRSVRPICRPSRRMRRRLDTDSCAALDEFEVWIAPISSQMESAQLERTTV